MNLELHVSGSGRFSSGGRDLFRQVTSRHDLLGEGDAVVFKEDHLELVSDVLVAVDDVGDVVEQLDDLLRHVVARGRFAA